jgi:hypothetical protein
VYKATLKETKFPQLTEKLIFWTHDIHVGKYQFKPGPNTLGIAEFHIFQNKDLNINLFAYSSYKIAEIGPDSYVNITEVKGNKMSGDFYLNLFQPITGANSLDILRCENGAFKNTPFY